MKLSTKILFTSLKNNPKRKFKKIKQRKSSVIGGLKNSSKNNNFYFERNEIQNLFKSKTTVNENPFKKPIITIRRLKSKKLPKIMNYNLKKKDIKIVKEEEALNEDFYINNILLTTQSEFNEYEPKDENIDIKHINNVEQNLDELCDLFRKSNIKSNFVIYNKKDNNLGLNPKDPIQDYFNKKYRNNSNKNKINSIPVQKYKENNNVFKQKSTLINRNKINKNGINNDKKQNLYDYNFKINKINKNASKNNTNIIHKLKKQKIKKNIIIGEHDKIMGGKEKNEIEDNSLFDAFYNHNSYESSFLSSNPFS